METKRAAAYIRVSTEEQTEYSPASQLEKIREYADKNGYYLDEKFIFADEGFSGKTTKKRTEFNRMISAAKTKPRPFDAILVWKFSRFARSREDSVVYKSMLRRELGISVVSVSEDVGNDKMSVLFESIIEAMDEYYSLNLAEEVKRGMAERIKRGGACAAAPFGYFSENKTLRVCDREAEFVKMAFESYADGESTVAIARKLNEIGVVTHRGNKIENRTVEYWLNNPVYIGKLRWSQSGKIPRGHWDESDAIIACGNHAPIISERLWERVRARLEKAERRKKYECKNPSAWLVGIFRCGICGGAMVNCGGYFYCGNKIKGACAGNGGVKAALIEREIAELMEKIAVRAEVSLIPCKKKRRETDVEEKLLRARRAYEAGVDSLCEYRENKERIMKQAEELEREEAGKPHICAVAELLKNEDVSAADKSCAARTVLDRVVKIGREEYDVFLNFRPEEDQTGN